ncbi:hypothetical protein N9B82_03730 [Saprospiraceae bacterium]|nr:hypothetical protein [Saprospiraceae bacterium]
MNKTLTFKRALLKRSRRPSDNRPYIDFLIDGVSLTEILEDVHNNIGKFGWLNTDEAPKRVEYELAAIDELKSTGKSTHENGLFSIYVCAECGDEGCLAVMFIREINDDSIIWSDFVWSNDEDEIDEAHTKFDTKQIIFDRREYDKALETLRIMVESI